VPKYDDMYGVVFEKEGEVLEGEGEHEHLIEKHGVDLDEVAKERFNYDRDAEEEKVHKYIEGAKGVGNVEELLE